MSGERESGKKEKGGKGIAYATSTLPQILLGHFTRFFQPWSLFTGYGGFNWLQNRFSRFIYFFFLNIVSRFIVLTFAVLFVISC